MTRPNTVVILENNILKYDEQLTHDLCFCHKIYNIGKQDENLLQENENPAL